MSIVVKPHFVPMNFNDFTVVGKKCEPLDLPFNHGYFHLIKISGHRYM